MLGRDVSEVWDCRSALHECCRARWLVEDAACGAVMGRCGVDRQLSPVSVSCYRSKVPHQSSYPHAPAVHICQTASQSPEGAHRTRSYLSSAGIDGISAGDACFRRGSWQAKSPNSHHLKVQA